MNSKAQITRELKVDIESALDVVKNEYGDTLRILGAETKEEIRDQIDGVEFNDDWDGIYWHSGYIAGIELALSYLKNETHLNKF